jgi:hypothetical protein
MFEWIVVFDLSIIVIMLAFIIAILLGIAEYLEER